jgi:hypothetical protein
MVIAQSIAEYGPVGGMVASAFSALDILIDSVAGVNIFTWVIVGFGTLLLWRVLGRAR